MGYFFEQATPEMVYYVSKYMRERDYEEVSAIRFDNDREEMAQSLARQFGNFPFCFCIGRDNVPICILVGLTTRPGVWNMGMWATDELPRVGKYLSGFITKHIFAAMRACGAHRVECQSISGYNEIHKWLRFLGFAQGETEKMFGKNKEDFITFYWIEGMPWPRGYDPSAECEVASQNSITEGDLPCAEEEAAEATAEPQNERDSARSGLAKG